MGDDWRPRLRPPPGDRTESFADGVSDYVAQAGSALVPWGFEEGARGFVNPHPSHEFYWSLDELRSAVEAAGLTIGVLEEYAYLNGAPLRAGMTAGPDRRWLAPRRVRDLPLTFGMRADAGASDANRTG